MLRYINNSVACSRRTTTTRRPFGNSCRRREEYGHEWDRCYVGKTPLPKWLPNSTRQLYKPLYFMTARHGTLRRQHWRGWKVSTFVQHLRWQRCIGQRARTVAISKVGGRARRVRDVLHCGVHSSTPADDCCVRGELPNFRVMPTRQSATYINAQTVVVGAADEAGRDQRWGANSADPSAN